MAIFGSKKEVTAKSIIDATAEALFIEYADIKKAEAIAKRRKDEITQALKELADGNQLWKGKTAQFLQYKLEKREVKTLVMPTRLDVEDNRLQDFLSLELDKKTVLKNLMEGNEDLAELGFEVEIKESYVPKGF